MHVCVHVCIPLRLDSTVGRQILVPETAPAQPNRGAALCSSLVLHGTVIHASCSYSCGGCHQLSSALLSGLLLPHHSLPLAEMFVGKDINLTTIQNYFNSVAIHGDKMNVFQRSASTKQRLRLGNETQATETEV